MKKSFLLLLLLPILSITYASNPNIIVVPKECLVNNSVYVIYQWEAPYTVKDFKVIVYSDGVDFENPILNYAAVVKDAGLFHIFKGKAIIPGNHTIDVRMEYTFDGVHIKKRFEYNISILPRIQYVEKVKVIEKIIVKNVTSTNTINKTLAEEVCNKTNVKTNVTTEITKMTNKETNKTKNIEKTENYSNKTNKEGGVFSDVMYGIAGLVLGVVFGFITMYVIRM